MSDKQHREDTKYLQWVSRMGVIYEDLLCDYEHALIENSLRDKVHFYRAKKHYLILGNFKEAGKLIGNYSCQLSLCKIDIKLTRAQALYIATGNTSI